MSNKNRKLKTNAVDKFFSDYTPEEQDTHKEQTEPTPTAIRGQKLPRINMAFTHENLEYLRSISKIKDISITQYVNDLIHADKLAKGEKVEEIEDALKNMLKEV